MAILKLREKPSLRRGLITLWKLDQNSVDALGTVLADASPAFDKDRLVEGIAASVDTVPKDDVTLIVGALTELASTVASVGVPAEIVADDAFDALIEIGTPDDKLSPQDRTYFVGRLERLMELEAIMVASKARLVLVEHEHYLCYARIMTDIRPVFGNDPSEKPSAAVIVHSLKIAYHDGGDTKEFFVALDPSSLERLSELIERAQAKEISLRALLASSGVANLNTE